MEEKIGFCRNAWYSVALCGNSGWSPGGDIIKHTVLVTESTAMDTGWGTIC